MNALIALLLVANVALFAVMQGALSGWVQDPREPTRLARQVNASQLTIVPLDGAADAPGTPVADAPEPVAVAAKATPVASPAPAEAEPAVSAPPSASVPTPAERVASPETPPVAPAEPASPRPAAPVQAAACVEWGPFAQADMVAAIASAQRSGFRTVDAVRREGRPNAWMVYVPPLANADEARQRAAVLRQQGVSDVYVLPDGPHRLGVSLGVFRSEESALTQQRQLVQRGISDTRIVTRAPERWALRMRSDQPVDDTVRNALMARHGGASWNACAQERS